MLTIVLITFLSYLVLLSQISVETKAIKLTPVPSFPLQFSGDISITAHLIEEESEYPPRVRKLKVWYDYMNKVARADIEAGE